MRRWLKHPVRHARRGARRIRARLRGAPPRDLRLSLDPRDIGAPGRDTDALFRHVVALPGAFTLDDCAHVRLILQLQRIHGVRGDLLEIGTHGGRAAAVMAASLAPKETLVVCDAFDLPDAAGRAANRTPARLMANLRAVVPELTDAAVRVHRCFSRDLALDPGDRFRFVHIDGDHSEAQTRADAELCWPHVVPGGVVALDDHGHPDFPGVAAAAERLLAHHADMRVLAELNRHGERGRKLYLHKTPAEHGLDAAPPGR